MQTNGYFKIEIAALKNIIVFEILLDSNTWNHATIYKLFIFDRNTWNHATIYKLFIFDMNTWNYATI